MSSTLIKILAVSIGIYFVWRVLNSGSHLPKGLPIVGAKEGDWFPYWQALWRNSFDVKTATLKAYRDHKGQAAILPVAGPGGQTFVLLPASETKSVTEQPETVLNLREVIVEGLLYRYTVSDNFLISHPVHKKLITTTLTNQIANILPDLAEETRWSFEHYWGTNTDSFRDVTIWESMGRIVGSATNRAFVGLPYCRDPALLDAGFGFAQAVPLSARLLSFVWKPLRFLASPLLTLPCRLYEYRFARILFPEIDRRMREMVDSSSPPSSSRLDPKIPEKNDFLQWSIKQAIDSGDPRMWKPRTLAGRILLLNLVSIHTSSLTITNVILDLVSSKPEVIEELRAEIKTILTETGGAWTKAAFVKMEKLDSVFRESARLNTLVAIGLRRKVVAKEGFTSSAGVHIPCGNFCAVHNVGVVHDASVFPDPDTFQPFRFVGMRRDIETDNSIDDHLQRARLTFAATGTDYLAFGNGRQACPGRFFAASELKMMLAYALMYYDLEMMEKRPSERWLGILRIPAPDAKIRIRRRKESI
ncbi:cytochrome P450 [Penicillium samsonianum]|uniref:cytochrome P450 n=1 Tax=Penicillium samsonianum TaxID=1882272 RepID=UPI00254658EA|nr:cytochrome P450 [Penicillium samsonianum]KAJ6131758.1 cytochrome P450 [Penicillium samsonianum]